MVSLTMWSLSKKQACTLCKIHFHILRALSCKRLQHPATLRYRKPGSDNFEWQETFFFFWWAVGISHWTQDILVNWNHMAINKNIIFTYTFSMCWIFVCSHLNTFKTLWSGLLWRKGFRFNCKKEKINIENVSRLLPCSLLAQPRHDSGFSFHNVTSFVITNKLYM